MPALHPKNGHLLIMLCLAEITTMLLFSSYAAVLPILQKEWQLTNTQAGWIFGSYQIGYLLAVILLTTMTDYVNPRYIYSASAFFAGISGLLFSYSAHGVISAMIFRTMAGTGLAGTYMPGLKIIADNFPQEKRGGAVGLYVGTFTLGVSLSLYLTGKLAAMYDWRSAFLFASIGPLMGGFIGFAALRTNLLPSPLVANRKEFSLKKAISNKPVVVMILAYMAHCWELFGLRGWIVAFLTAALITGGKTLSQAAESASYVAALVMLVGTPANMISGFISDKIGRLRSIVITMLVGSALSFTIGWTVKFPFPWVLLIALLYGIFVTADSSPISTAITEFADPAIRGSTMAVQSFLGFAAASISPIAVGWLLDLADDSFGLLKWGWGFAVLGAGSLVGPLAIYYLKR